MAYQSFENLEVWQRGCRLSVAVFEAFEKCKRFTLRDQIERAGLSVPSNIAEGAERGSNKDFAHFLNFSKASCGELRTQLYIARKLNELDKGSFDSLLRESREISAMLQGLRTAVLKKSAPTKARTPEALKT
jgi:four helix bundle protein